MNEKEIINADVKYEPKDASGKWLGAIFALIVITAIILTFFLWGLYGYFGQTARGPAISEAVGKQSFETQKSLPLEPNPVGSYENFRQSEGKKLNGYGWVDKQKGIVHIPIEQAMQKLMKEGLPEIQRNTNLSNENPQNLKTNSNTMTRKNITEK